MLFKQAVQKLKDTLEKGCTYVITNGVAKKPNPNYSNINLDIELILTNSTMVQESSIHVPLDVINYEFMDFQDLPHCDQSKRIGK